MNKYNEKLEEIIRKYDYEAEEIISSTQINAAIIDIFTQRCVNKKVAIWGVGKKNTINSHAAVIISKYILNLNGLEYLVDSSPDMQGTKFMGYPIIAPEELPYKNVDIVIIGSRASANAIIKNLKEIYPKCEYINIYEELRKRGIVIDYNFFSEQNMYTQLYQLRLKYEKINELEKKSIILKKIISGYLKIRDFYYAKKYINIYIKNKYKDYEKLIEMIDKIEKLQDEIIEINQTKKGNILVHLIDSLRAIDVYDNNESKLKFKMFNSYEENAIIFSKAYSTGPTTYESMMGVIKQKLSFEEDVYNNNFMFDFNEFSLLKLMKKEDKRIIFYVASDYYIMEESKELERKEHLHMSEKLWNVACDMADSEKEIFGFIYYPWELHFPLLCGYLRNEPKIKHFSDVGIEDMSDFIVEQFEDCKNYVDLQFQYYKSLLGEYTTNVFMGDHSQPVYNSEHINYPYYMYYNDPDRVSHIAFFVTGKEYEKVNYDKLVTMLDFNKIMEQIIFKRKLELPNRSLIQFQYYNIQNKKLREIAEKYDYWDYTEGIQCFLSKDYLYIITATGKEELYSLKQKDINIINSNIGQEFISYVKSNYDISFPKFWTIRYKKI